MRNNNNNNNKTFSLAAYAVVIKQKESVLQQYRFPVHLRHKYLDLVKL